jgi:hypothetical protein
MDALLKSAKPLRTCTNVPQTIAQDSRGTNVTKLRLISKPDKHTQKENHSSVFLRNIDAKILSKILTKPNSTTH